MLSSNTCLPDSLGAISSTSRSAVGRESPYTMLITNPPMQSRRMSSPTAESNSRKNDNQDSGRPLLCRVGKMLSLHVGQEIPVSCDGRTMFSQPRSFGLRHRVVAEGIFACKPRTLQNFQMSSKLSRPLNVILAFCHVTRQRDGKP